LKWYKKLVILLTLGIVAALAVASVASADPPDTVKRLEAHGDGLAALRGDGKVWLRGNGILWVKGHGHKKDFPSGWTEYVGFHGAAVIEGRGVSVILAAENLDLHAVGRGRAILWGEGRYTSDGATTERWSDGIQVIPYWSGVGGADPRPCLPISARSETRRSDSVIGQIPLRKPPAAQPRGYTLWAQKPVPALRP